MARLLSLTMLGGARHRPDRVDGAVGAERRSPARIGVASELGGSGLRMLFALAAVVLNASLLVFAFRLLTAQPGAARGGCCRAR